MELLIIKLAAYIVTMVGTFLIGVFVLFATPYAFFYAPLLFVENDSWIAKFCRWCIGKTWKLQRLFLPYGIVLMLGSGKKK